MTYTRPGSASAAPPGQRRPKDRAGQCGPVSVASFGILVLALLAGGCSSGVGMMELTSSKQFQQRVLQAKRPVMVHFLKAGCPRCWLLETAMDQLVNDYQDRAVFVKYYLMNIFWTVTNPELKSKYDIAVYPTVVLFVNGQEKRRWVMHYDIRSYRKALDEALSTPAVRTTQAPVAAMLGTTRVP
jgi:thiol-disulfide isomerase/thioredoxin